MQTPIEDFTLPIRSLQNWFPDEVVVGKREQVGKLIQQLMVEQNVTNIQLPNVTFPSVNKVNVAEEKDKNDESPKGDEVKTSNEDTSTTKTEIEQKCIDSNKVSSDGSNLPQISEPQTNQSPEKTVDNSTSQCSEDKSSAPESAIDKDSSPANTISATVKPEVNSVEEKTVNELTIKRKLEDTSSISEESLKKICIEKQ